jgi:hypothetical protein
MNEEEKTEPVTNEQETEIDENMSLIVYGNVKIRDVDTGEILVNKRF